MEEEKCVRTIIQNIGAYQDYPFDGIDSHSLRVFRLAKDKLPTGLNGTVPAVLKAFDCFLQITGRSLTLLDLSRRSFRITCEEFLGALYSERFIALTPTRRYYYAHALKRLLIASKQYVPELFQVGFHISSVGPTSFVNSCIERFNKLELQEESVWLWSGWPSTNRSGRVTWLRLYPLYQRLGRDFTQRMHQTCDEYYSGRKCHRIIAISELATFIHLYPGDLTPQDFQSPQFITRFWRQFFMYYVRVGYASRVSIEVLITNWRAEFAYFVEEYLIGSGLFAEPFGEFPCPEPRRVEGPRTHIKETEEGTEVKVKLLTHLPLQVTDSEAMELLFKQIQDDVDLIVNWATWATDEIWERHQRRLRLAPQGQARTIQAGNNANNGQKWLTSRKNPDHLKNAAATFSRHGYVTKADIAIAVLFPTPLSQTAFELGLPTTGALLPHCILLVATHPVITPSFLETLELYDKNGKRIGLIETDGGFALNGRKARNGSKQSQQIIKLTEVTARIVQQIIELTDPIRSYLRERGDDNWRYLLLTSQKGFSYPTQVRRIATDTSNPDRLSALAVSLGNTASISYENRFDFAKRFSLPSLRASVAVLIYIRTRDAKKMAEALGHTGYSAKLLSRYLPDPVLTFFQERWARIFQSGIIVEALKDSDYLLDASPFNSMEELNQFLKNHALKRLPEHIAESNADTKIASTFAVPPTTEVVFGVNAGVLTALISLQLAVQAAIQKPSGKAIYWAGIAEHLVSYLESELCQRDDLKSYLAAAKRRAAPEKMEALIYA